MTFTPKSLQLLLTHVNSPCLAWAPCWGLLRCPKRASGWWQTQPLCLVELIYSDQKRCRSAQRKCPAHCAASDGWASTYWCPPWGRGKWCCPLRCGGDCCCETSPAGPPSAASPTERSPSPFQKTEACSWRSWAALGPSTNWVWSNLFMRRKIRGKHSSQLLQNAKNWCCN